MIPVTIRRPRGGYLILVPLMLATCGAAPVGSVALARIVGWFLLYVAGVYLFAFALRWADQWAERRRFSRAIRQAEADGVILLARERRGRVGG